jgi:hypothetical protein
MAVVVVIASAASVFVLARDTSTSAVGSACLEQTGSASNLDRIRTIRCDDPSDAENWAVGCTGKVQGNGPIQSVGEPVQVPGNEPAQVGDPTFPLIRTPADFKPRRQANVQIVRNSDEVTLFEAEGPGCVRHLWMTTSVAGRGLRIRVHVDDAPEPQVDMELNRFFGILLGKNPYLVESPGVKVLPLNSYNCYLPIPFSQSCRVTLRAEAMEGLLDPKAELYKEGKPEKAAIYFQADWQQYRSAAGLTPYRLHALFREENPAQHYGYFRAADIEGRGFIAGMFKAIRRLDRNDLLYHTGGSTWLLDGEIEPNAYRGLNEEDDFGFSFGFFDRYQSQWVGSPLQNPEGTPCDEYVAWRFFGPDPVPFRSSFRLDYGSRADHVQSVLYYYKVPGSEAPTLLAPEQWEIRAPFACESFEDFDREESADQISEAAFRTTLASSRGWVDARPALAQTRSLGKFSGRWPNGFSLYADASLVSDIRKDVTLRLAFDDWLTLWVNGRKITTLRHDRGFDIARVPVTLEKGQNTIRIKLNNTANRENFLWAFNAAVESP